MLYTKVNWVKSQAIALVTFMFIVFTPALSAAIIQVTQGESISAALAAGNDGDVFLIEPGIYPEALVISKSQALICSDPAGHFELDPPPSTTNAVLVTGETVTIQGLKLQNFSGHAGLKNKGRLYLNNAQFQFNQTRYGAIYNKGHLSAYQLQVFSNTTELGYWGGGITNWFAVLEITNGYISNNVGAYGGIFNRGEIFMDHSNISSNVGLFGGYYNTSGGKLVGFQTLLSANLGSNCNTFSDPDRGGCFDNWTWFL